jgi:hypothetical protein
MDLEVAIELQLQAEVGSGRINLLRDRSMWRLFPMEKDEVNGVYPSDI